MDVDAIIKKISEHFGVNPEDVLSKNKKSKVSLARGFCYYVLHYNEDCLSISKISRKFNRSERGVKIIISNLKYLIETQRKYKTMYADVLNDL